MIGWYVYGVIDAGHAAVADPPAGIGGTRTELVTDHQLAAIAAQVDVATMGDVRDQAAQAHDRVVEGTLARVPVVPFRFGTVCATRADVERMLRSRGPALAGALRRIAGAAEWDVRLVAGPAEVITPGSGRPQDATGAADNAAWLMRRRDDARAGAARRTRWARVAADLHARLAPIAREAVQAARTRLTPMHVVYLVARDDEDAFVTALCRARAAHVDPDLRVSLSGPRAAYHFTEEPLAAADRPAVGAGPGRR
jgi:hypothetical protein